MLDRWRVLSLLISLCMVLGAVELMSVAGSQNDRISQTGEISTPVVRRFESPVLDPGSDEVPVKPPVSELSSSGTVREHEPVAARPAVHRSVERRGPGSPRGPPLLG